MATVQLTEPTEEPVTDAEAREHLRITDSTLDLALIWALIAAARQRAELFTERAFISRSFGMYMDRFPSGEFRFPHAPLISVQSVNYYDASNVEQILANSEYFVDALSKPGRLAPATSWPGTYARPNAVSIVFTAGFGAAANVPQVIKQAMLLMIGDMYENREETTTGTASFMPVSAEMLLRPFRMVA